MENPDIVYTIDLIQPDVPTANGRIYSKDVINEIVNKTNLNILKKKPVLLYSTLGNDLTNAVGVVENSRLVNDRIVIDIKLLDTTTALVVKELLSDPKTFCITPTSVGTVDENNRVTSLDDVQYYNIAPRI